MRINKEFVVSGEKGNNVGEGKIRKTISPYDITPDDNQMKILEDRWTNNSLLVSWRMNIVLDWARLGPKCK